MDISASLAGGRTATRTGTAAQTGAWTVFLGTVITTAGLSWDIQWHTEVGPDTFFTLSHLALYSGSALSGIASLVMVLLATAAQRAGRPMPGTVGGTPVRVFGGVFTAPLGYLVSGDRRGVVPALRPAGPVVALDLRLRRRPEHPVARRPVPVDLASP